MIRKLPSPKVGHVRIIFELPACVWADRIFLVGDFNEWNTMISPFAQGRDGVWRVTVDLPGGREYQFRYLVDGTWQTDNHADGWASNEYGSQNSIVNAVLPPTALPSPGPTSLLHEKTSEALRPFAKADIHGPRNVVSTRTSAPNRFFPAQTRIAG
ncbi:MAG: isoamylase early set domain-containing protein [Caldilineaceae bacterium]|nr:isoamylase early set domain-containing protein [Caldilineaceae bacterium]